MKYKAKLYYSPNAAGFKSTNRYTQRQLQELSKHFDVTNRLAPTSIGIFDIFRKIFQIDILFCNWIENTPDKRLGYIQSLALLIFLYIKGFWGIKVIWVLHNKVSHTKTNRRLKSFLMRTLLNKSDLILTHSQDGVAFARSMNPDSAPKVRFFHHPVTEFTAQGNADRDKSIDVLIWGAVHSYKGVQEFLQLLADHDALDRYRILIWGKFSDDEYLRDCLRFQSDNIEIRNRFISDDELADAHANTRAVLFTYQTDSVLSSGALMDSLNSSAIIIGPDGGAFRDLAQEGYIETYHDRSDLIETIDRALRSDKAGDDIVAKRTLFFEHNSWPLTTQRISDAIIDELVKAEHSATNNQAYRSGTPDGR